MGYQIASVTIYRSGATVDISIRGDDGRIENWSLADLTNLFYEEGPEDRHDRLVISVGVAIAANGQPMLEVVTAPNDQRHDSIAMHTEDN